MQPFSCVKAHIPPGRSPRPVRVLDRLGVNKGLPESIRKEKRGRRDDFRTTDGLAERDFNRFLEDFRAWCMSGEMSRVTLRMWQSSLLAF